MGETMNSYAVRCGERPMWSDMVILKYEFVKTSAASQYGTRPRELFVVLFPDKRLLSALSRLLTFLLRHMSQGNLVQWVGFGLEDQGSIPGRGGEGIFLFATASSPALVSTKPPVQWLPGAPSTEVKSPGCVTDHSPPPSAEEVRDAWGCTSTPYASSWRGALVKHRDDFALLYFSLLLVYRTLFWFSSVSCDKQQPELMTPQSSCVYFLPEDGVRASLRSIIFLSIQRATSELNSS
jgi:hypothetical protein